MVETSPPAAVAGAREASWFSGSAKPTATRSSWTLDPGKVLDIAEVELVLASARAARDRALRGGARVAARDCFLAELALYSGLRVAELAALRPSDLVLGDYAAVHVRCGKGHKPRTVRVGSELRRAGQQFLAWKTDAGEPAGEDAPLFRSSATARALTPRALQQSWARTLRRAGVRHRGIHAARHTYATHLAAASGNNLRLVQRQLGHSSLATTETYLAVMSDAIGAALDNLYRMK